VLAWIFGGRLTTLRMRAYDIGPLTDTLIICAVGTILIIRTQLWLTNYPQLGGHGLHIAHLLWGGVGMLIAIVLLVSFVSPAVRRLGAILGGIGLGFFIDELGKFLTSDNNYFFKPTAAIIYIFFIILYIVTRALQARKQYTPDECLVNSLEISKDAVLGQMDRDERRMALKFLDGADQSNPAVGPLRQVIETAQIRDESKPSLVQRVLDWGRATYARLAGNRWFIRVITAVFVLWGFAAIIEVISLIFTLEPHLRSQHTVKIVTPLTSKGGNYGFVEWANIVGSLTVGGLVLWGLLRLRRSRLAAYTMWDHALLVDIFFVQVFAFIQSQFGACVGFVIDVVLLVSVRFMAARERELMLEGEDEEDQEPALARPVPA
jgi:hypothetical protein